MHTISTREMLSFGIKQHKVSSITLWLKKHNHILNLLYYGHCGRGLYPSCFVQRGTYTHCSWDWMQGCFSWQRALVLTPSNKREAAVSWELIVEYPLCPQDKGPAARSTPASRPAKRILTFSGPCLTVHATVLREEADVIAEQEALNIQ